MKEKQQITDTQQNNEHFTIVLKELTSLKDQYALSKLEVYKKRNKRSMYFFRVSGILIVILSISIPFLTTLEGTWRTIILPTIALASAGLTGLNTFFRWESSWKDFWQAQSLLENALARWELRIITAKTERDMQKAMELAMEATKQLLEDVGSTTAAQAEEFFKRVQLPKTQ